MREPTIGPMRRPAVVFCVTSVLLAGPEAAAAAPVPVLGADGTVSTRAEPAVRAREAADPALTHLEERAGLPRAAASGSRTVLGELRRMRRAGSIDAATYRSRRDVYRDFRSVVPRYSGVRRTEMAGVLRLVDAFAARGKLTASRLPALRLTLARNRRWWSMGPLLAGRQRVEFEGSELVWQYFPGSGLQLHPLANFGKLNWLARTKGLGARSEALLDELLELPARRAGGLAWEYAFDYGGGRGPWVSGLAQGTGLQALSKAAVRAGRAGEVLPRLREGLAMFRTPPPAGIRVAGPDGGIHYLEYSFAPGLRILNGFVQSLVGLWDFSVTASDDGARALFLEGERSARAEVPTFDTGAWSLYSRGTSVRESDLNYHVLVRDFLESLCDRYPRDVYCDAERDFTRYLREAPEVRLRTRRLRAGRTAALRFRLSKISTVWVRVTRGDRVVLSRSAVLSYGRRAQWLRVPRRRGTYDVTFVSTDLAGNRGVLETTVDVVR